MRQEILEYRHTKSTQRWRMAGSEISRIQDYNTVLLARYVVLTLLTRVKPTTNFRTVAINKILFATLHTRVDSSTHSPQRKSFS